MDQICSLGIGFLKYLGQDLDTVAGEGGAHIAQFRRHIQVALKKLKDLRIPIEVNPTSNDYLQGTGQSDATANAAGVFDTDLLYKLLHKGFCGIVCTDNDGIWPTRLGEYSSVAAEVIRLTRGPNNDIRLQPKDVDRLMENYEHAAFGSRDSRDPAPRSK